MKKRNNPGCECCGPCCCDVPVADTLYATISATAGCTCAGLPVTITLTYSTATMQWTGSGTVCTYSTDITFFCVGETWPCVWNLTFDGCGTRTDTQVSKVCDPLSVAFEPFGLTNCCPGQLGFGELDIVVTE